VLLVGCAIVIVAQLAKVQIADHAFYQGWGDEIRVRSIVMTEPPRGIIRDRDGNLLAGNAVLYSIEAAPSYVVDAGAAAAALAERLHIPAGHIEQQLTSDLSWVQIASPVSKEVGEEIAALRISGITVKSLWAREYPEGTLAAHALGFCNAEGIGFYGVEGFYDTQLKPERVERVVAVDPASDPIPWDVAPVVMPQPGTELILTLDRTVQALAEAELARAVRDYDATGGTIIVMDPRDFGILALASLPAYEPARYADFLDFDPSPVEDPAVSWQYEPGSVFKVLTVAAAFDIGMVTPESTYSDSGAIEVGGQVIQNATRLAYGQQTVSDILIKSLNVGAAWLSTQMGSEVFYRYVRAFGIGQPTGVDLQGEIAGQLWLPGDFEHWHDSNLGTNSFGQGVAVTPLQMITAIATVANDGTRLRPHVVSRRIASDGAVSIFQPVVEAQAITPQTARTVAEIMVRGVEEGATQARIPGYRIAGKTGTAQIPIPGGYDRNGTIVSFVGFAPLPDPQVIILVKLDRPQTSTWAGDTAVPTFRRLAERLFVVLGIPPQGTAVAEAR
jgi:cell division protein FtsI/penicillin-binding protein 2